MILSAVAIYTGYDQVLQIKFAEFCSANGINFLDRFQTNASVTQALENLRKPASDLSQYGKAPEFVGIMNWLNVDQPLTLESLKGKVVLVDFWTYSCINCIRTLPYLTTWYEKYHDQGLVIIGVHTPEFEFEKKTANVADALERYGITYPVAQDNNYATWQAYNNHYWPAHYLIDAKGVIREYHFGEGNYEETERAIQDLLKEAGQTVTDSLSQVKGETAGRAQTPETYLGASRMERFDSPEKVNLGQMNFTLPTSVSLHHFAYGGTWTVEAERAVAEREAKLQLHFQGKKVYLVLAPSASGARSGVTVLLDGKPVEQGVAGSDVHDGRVTVDEERLYELIDLQGKDEEHSLELQVDPGVAVYAFTFS